MKERPILFSAPMVKAILENRKTQTRRALKIQPTIIRDPFPTTDDVKHVFRFKQETGIYKCLGMQNLIDTCKFGKVGDRLWVRETWRGVVPINHPDRAPEYGVARYVPEKENCKRVEYSATQEPDGEPWRPSIHMPRWASRINLEITGVRVERLQDISDDDCLAEGSENSNLPGIIREKYKQLWESINGQGSWDLNPWVWVIEFKRIA